MTNEEAQQMILSAAYNIFVDKEDLKEAAKIACEALEKMIPMRPQKIINDLGVFGKMNGYLSGCCNIALRIRHDGDGEPIDYFCTKCGKKIDWTGEFEL